MGLEQFFFNFANYVENIGFSILITVCADAEIDFVFAGVISEGGGSANDGVRRGHFDVGEEVVGGEHSDDFLDHHYYVKKYRY